MVSPHDLAALSPDEAGRLVADLAAAGRVDALVMVVTATPPHRYPIAALLRTPPACPSTYERDMLVRAVALAPAVRLRSALDEVGADPALEDVLTQVAAVRTALAAETAVPLVGRARDGDGRAHGRRQRATGRRTEPGETVLPRPWRRRHPQVLPPPRRRGHRAAGRRGDRPALRGHPRPPAAQGQRSWSPARRWSCRWARPSSSRSCCSTTRRRSRSPAARARASPSPTCSPTRR